MEKGSERKKGVQCGAVVDCGSSMGGQELSGAGKTTQWVIEHKGTAVHGGEWEEEKEFA